MLNGSQSNMGTLPSKPRLSVSTASEADIPFIMSVERLPGYAALVGTYDETEHRRRLATPNTDYLLGHLGSVPVGFAVVRLDDDAMGNAQLHRIAVAPAGLGHGSVFLRQICRRVFALPNVGRLWLDLLPSNVHAQGVYSKLGFVKEGTLREALQLNDGGREDLLLMSLLREEWNRLDA